MRLRMRNTNTGMAPPRPGLPLQLTLLAALSLADGLATCALVASGVSYELNPFMAPYVRAGLLQTTAVKVTVWSAVAAGIAFLYKAGLKAFSEATTRAAIWLYSLVGVWHTLLLAATKLGL